MLDKWMDTDINYSWEKIDAIIQSLGVDEGE